MDEPSSDAVLWERARSGDERACAVLFERHRQRIFRAAYGRVGCVPDAEDVVATVFLDMWRLRNRVRIIDGSLLPWLLAVTSNVALNLMRGQRRYRRLLCALPPCPSVEDPAIGVGERMDRQSRWEGIARALRRLAPIDRAVVDLCLIEERPISAAAAILRIPEGTIKSRLHRARCQLRAALTEADVSGPDGDTMGVSTEGELA